MSYTPSHVGPVKMLAVPESLGFFDGEIDGACSTGTTIKYLNAQVKFGSWSPSIASGVITLPSGYWYFLEGTVQFYPLNDFYNHTLESQWYDNTNSQYLGQKTFIAPQITEQDDQPTSRADTARALIDCTSNDIDVKCQIIATNETTNINYDGHNQYIYGSFGRCVIWRLNA